MPQPNQPTLGPGAITAQPNAVINSADKQFVQLIGAAVVALQALRPPATT